jgi:ribosome-binding factor A
MKFKKPSRKHLRALSEEIAADDGTDPRTFFGKSHHKKTNRKALQLCGEVSRTLSQVLAWESSEAILRDLMIESVVPAPDSSHLLVTVSVPPGVEAVAAGKILERLRGASGRLRSEIAASIHRRRVPLLSFRVAGKGVGP